MTIAYDDDQMGTKIANQESDAYWSSIQDENGVDLTIIRANLRRTPLERLRLADAGRRSALRLMEAGKLNREQRAKSA